eukprot:351808-Chlamydomonas_euryale.AAC.2
MTRSSAPRGNGRRRPEDSLNDAGDGSLYSEPPLPRSSLRPSFSCGRMHVNELGSSLHNRPPLTHPSLRPPFPCGHAHASGLEFLGVALQSLLGGIQEVQEKRVKGVKCQSLVVAAGSFEHTHCPSSFAASAAHVPARTGMYLRVPACTGLPLDR